MNSCRHPLQVMGAFIFCVAALAACASDSTVIDKGSASKDNSQAAENVPDMPSHASVTGIHASGGTMVWNGVADATYYRVWYFDGYGSAELGEVAASKQQYPLNGFAANADHTVGVSACNSIGCSNAKMVLFRTLLTASPAGTPAMPENVRVTDIYSFGATLRWNTVAGATTYKVWYVLSTPVEMAEVAHPQDQYAFGGLGADGEHSVAVSACNAAGCSDIQVIVFQTPPSTPSGVPEMPDNVRVTDIHPFGGTLRWDAVAGAVTYKVWYLGGPLPAELGEVAHPQSHYVLNGFAADGDHSVAVSACNSVGCSNAEVIFFHTPSSTPPGVPEMPDNVRVTDIHWFGGTLRWDAVAGAVTYKVWYLGGPLPAELGEVAHPQSAYVLNGFAAGADHRVAVSACNAVGCSNAEVIVFHTLPL